MKKREDFLYYSRPCADEAEIQALAEVVKSGWWTTGQKTQMFEETFAERVGAKYALAVNSCTAALHLAMVVNGFGPGDEVLTTPMTFCSTVNTILNCGAKPVFVDVDPETGLIDTDLLASHVTKNTKGIVPVHYAGQVCDMDALNALRDRYNLKIVEDAAHALTSRYHGKTVGSFGNSTCFSFYVTKNLSTGEGGMLTSDDEALIRHARSLSLHGMNHDAWKRYGSKGNWQYSVEEAGFKYNITDLASALGLEQMKKLDWMQQRRKEYAALYDMLLADCDAVDRVKANEGVESSEHLYVLKLNLDRLTIDRSAFIEELSDYNIGTSVHFIPLHLQPLYQKTLGTRQGDFPNCESYFNRILSLPLYPSMTVEDVHYVAEAVREIAGKFGK